MYAVGIHPLQFDAILCAVSSKRRSSRNSGTVKNADEPYDDDDFNEYQSDWTWRNSNSGTGEDEDHHHKNEEERHKNKGNAILQRLICEQYPKFFEDDEEEEEEEFDQDQEEGKNDDDDIVENLRAVRDVVPTTIFTTEASLPPLSSSSVTRRGKRSRNDNSRNRRNNDTTTTTSCTGTTTKAMVEETTKNSNSNSNKKMKIVNDIIQQFDGRFLTAIVCPQQRQTYSSFCVVNRNDVKALIVSYSILTSIVFHIVRVFGTIVYLILGEERQCAQFFVLFFSSIPYTHAVSYYSFFYFLHISNPTNQGMEILSIATQQYHYYCHR